jgi:hypothetical protein
MECISVPQHQNLGLAAAHYLHEIHHVYDNHRVHGIHYDDHHDVLSDAPVSTQHRYVSLQQPADFEELEELLHPVQHRANRCGQTLDMLSMLQLVLLIQHTAPFHPDCYDNERLILHHVQI